MVAISKTRTQVEAIKQDEDLPYLYWVSPAEVTAGLDAAVERGNAALELTANLDSTRGVDRLRDLVNQLRPHTKVPVVRDFVDRTRDLVTV